MQAAPSDPFGLIGTILDGQYRVERVVGEGGFGVVYRGYHLTFEQPIAIKVLKLPGLDMATQNSVLARFRDEAKLSYVLSQASLNIVRSVGFGEIRSPLGGVTPFVVLEWLEGKSLAADLAERRAAGLPGRTLEQAMALLDPAARGLIAAHHQRVAHRDVKPANFFITETADLPRVPTMKVLDFGIAKIMTDDDPARVTAFVSFTPFYAAPEQLDARFGRTGLHTDVYSFAVVLVEVLTGRMPTGEQGLVGIIKEATDPTRRPTPRNRGVAVPDAVEGVFERALALEPRARYGDLEQMWESLKKALSAAGPTGTAALASVPPRAARVPTQPMRASSTPPTRPMFPSLSTPPPVAVPAFSPGGAPPRQISTIPQSWRVETPSPSIGGGARWAGLGLFVLALLGLFAWVVYFKACG